MLRPMNDKVLIKLDPLETTTKHGIIIPDQYQKRERSVFGTVLKVGDKVSDVKAGDRVTCCKHQGDDLKINGVDHVVLREQFIDGVFYE